MSPLFDALELSRTIKVIEVAEIHFRKCFRFEISEILSDLKFKKIESLERLIRKPWVVKAPRA